MKRREFLQHLNKCQCHLIREGGNHSWWGHTTNRTRSAVPRHTEINDLLIRKICRDLQIPQP